jgi:hypothetical protein
LRNLQSLDNERGTGCAFQSNSARAIRLILGRSSRPIVYRQGHRRHIHVADLGATAKDSAGHDLGVKTFLNGALVSNIVIDTT